MRCAWHSLDVCTDKSADGTDHPTAPLHRYYRPIIVFRIIRYQPKATDMTMNGYLFTLWPSSYHHDIFTPVHHHVICNHMIHTSVVSQHQTMMMICLSFRRGVEHCSGGGGGGLTRCDNRYRPHTEVYMQVPGHSFRTSRKTCLSTVPWTRLFHRFVIGVLVNIGPGIDIPCMMVSHIPLHHWNSLTML